MSDVTLQFVLGEAWSSRMIAWWGTGMGGYSHTDGVLEDKTLIGARSDVIGKVAAGVRLRPVDYEKWKKQTVVTFPNTEGLYPKWSEWLTQQIGCGYDKGDIIGFILGIELMQEGHWICSALQYAALQSVRLLPPCPIPPQQITPNGLFLMCCAAGAVITLRNRDTHTP